jgi:hypothetical protein
MQIVQEGKKISQRQLQKNYEGNGQQNLKLNGYH